MSLLQVNTIRNKNGNSAPSLDRGINISGVSTLGIVKVSSGIVTATTGIVTYYGDAQYLKNVGSAITSIPTDLIVSGILTVTTLNATDNVSVANTVYSSDIISSGSLSVGSSITGSSIYGNGGNLTGIVTSLIAGTNITLTGSTGSVTINAVVPPPDLTDIVDDTTPQLGGDLDLNSKNITGIGSINISGIITASSFVGNIVGNVTGTASTASHTSITNDTSSTSNHYLTFVSASSGSRPQKVRSDGLLYVPSTNKLTASGSILVGGNLSANGILTVSGISTFNDNVRIELNKSLTVTGISSFTGNAHFVNGATCTGIITATDFNSPSDLNLKKNIKVIDNSVDKLSEITGVSFDWKSNDKKSLGVIAQDVEKVFPELVNTSEKGYLSLNYNGLIAVLIESIKELKKEIEELKSNK